MNGRRLLIDAGNTRLKWVVVEDGQWRAQGSARYDNLAELGRVLTAGTVCYIASVTRAQHEAGISALLEPFGISPSWLVAEARFADVVNGYENPRQLGVDRWMALIAARRRTHNPVLVVSAGTAMTVDALSADGMFMGGLIVPGGALMRHALQEGTARIAEADGEWKAFPRTTADAVQSGIVAALCGAVQVQLTHLAEAGGAKPHCFLTGGDAAGLLPHLGAPAKHVPALVLEGMDWVTRGMGPL